MMSFSPDSLSVGVFGISPSFLASIRPLSRVQLIQQRAKELYRKLFVVATTPLTSGRGNLE
jgi:hypothetical protein